MSLTPLTPLETLLRDLGSRIRPGGSGMEPPGRWSTGLADVDRLLGGGIPRGRLCELVGGASSGRTALALAWLAALTRRGEHGAWVDLLDRFDPPSARLAGVELSRVLWIRAPRPREALRSVERLLEARGFAGVFLEADSLRLPPASSLRLHRRAAASGTTLVLLASGSLAGSFAELTLATRGVRPAFSEPPEWLEGLEVHLELLRHRSAPSGGGAPLALRNVA